MTVALLADSTYDARGGMSTRTVGRLCRCPICTTMYVELGDKVERCGVEPTAPAATKDVPPERRRPVNFPSLPEDMVHQFSSREPR